jgi:MFS family permease
VFKAFTLEGYDRNFKLFLYLMSGTQAQQAILVTLTKEMTHTIPYVSAVREIGDISAYGRIAMAVGAILWAYLGERYSRKLLLIAGGILNTIPFLLSILAPNYATLMGSHLISFMGRGVYLGLAPTIVMDMTSRERRGHALSVTAIAALGGAALGTMLPSFIVDLLSWKEPMLIVGLFCLSGLLVTFLVRIPERGAQDLASATEPDRAAELPQASEYATLLDLSALVRVFSIRSNLAVITFFAVVQLSFGGIGAYVFTIFKEEYGLSAPVTMGIVMGAQSLVMIGTGYWGTRSDEALSKRPDGRIRTLIVAGLVATVFQAFSYLILPAYRVSPWFLAGYILFSLLASFASVAALQPLMNSIVGDTCPLELRSLSIAARNLVGVLAAGGGTLVVGWMHAAQGTFTWGTIALSCIGLGAVLVLVPARKAVPREMEALEAQLQGTADAPATSKGEGGAAG